MSAAEHTRYKVWCGFKLAELARQGSAESAAFAKIVRNRITSPVSREPGIIPTMAPAQIPVSPFHSTTPTETEQTDHVC